MREQMPAFEDLTPEQKQRFGQVVDSRVRLLGEYYGSAVEAVQRDGAGNAEWILGPRRPVPQHPAGKVNET